MTAVHASTSDPPPANRRRGVTESVTACVVVLLVAAISIVIQQTVFHHFVSEVGGKPDGLFKTVRGDHYRMWSFTVPLWATGRAMLAIGIGWLVRFRRRGHGWFEVILWIMYVAIVWSLTVASSGLVEILGKGEAFI